MKNIDKIKKDLEEILIQYCMLEDDNRQTMERCVRAVKIYLSKNRLIKSCRVNCHTKKHATKDVIVPKLTVEMTPHEGKTTVLEMELHLEPVALNDVIEDRKPKNRR